MILRRFTKHVTDQNWFAVGLDVIVVMVGIFLGLQMTEWNESKKDARYASYILGKIHLNLKQDIEFIHTVIEPRLQRKENAIKTFESLLTSGEKLSDEKFMQLYNEIKVPFLLTFKTGAYEELKLRGFGIMKNDVLAGKLYSIYESLLPRVAGFLSVDDETIKKYVDSFEKDYLEIYTGESVHMRRPKQDNLVFTQEFRWVLRKITFDSRHKRYRINDLQKAYKKILSEVEVELIKNR